MPNNELIIYQHTHTHTREGRNYYEILGVEPTASAAEIKRVYRNLSREYHPDRLGNKAVVEGKCYGSVSWEETMVKCGSSRTNEEEKHYCSEDCREFWTTSEERFKEIARAYGVLSDEVKRRDYDNGGVGRDIGDINDFRAEIIADIERIIVEKKLTAKELSACNMPLNWKEAINAMNERDGIGKVLLNFSFSVKAIEGQRKLLPWLVAWLVVLLVVFFSSDYYSRKKNPLTTSGEKKNRRDYHRKWFWYGFFAKIIWKVFLVAAIYKLIFANPLIIKKMAAVINLFTKEDLEKTRSIVVWIIGALSPFLLGLVDNFLFASWIFHLIRWLTVHYQYEKQKPLAEKN